MGGVGVWVGVGWVCVGGKRAGCREQYCFNNVPECWLKHCAAFIVGRPCPVRSSLLCSSPVSSRLPSVSSGRSYQQAMTLRTTPLPHPPGHSNTTAHSHNAGRHSPVSSRLTSVSSGKSSQQAMTTVPTASSPRRPARPAIWVYSPGSSVLPSK